MKKGREILIESAVGLARSTASRKIILFLSSEEECRWFLGSGLAPENLFVLAVPKGLKLSESEYQKAGINVVTCWYGSLTRFSRIKYAFLRCVLKGLITTKSRVVCVLGPWEKTHLDTITVHDLKLSWTEEFPFDPSYIANLKAFNTVMAVVDIALDIGALGREGKSIGTSFIIGDAENVISKSHQAVFNPFKGYPRRERTIVRSEVVESIKEFAQLDGAFIISEDGVVEAAGRHLDATSVRGKHMRGLGSRHRAASGITRSTEAVAVVVSESTGRVSLFAQGRMVSALEPVISRRLV